MASLTDDRIATFSVPERASCAAIRRAALVLAVGVALVVSFIAASFTAVDVTAETIKPDASLVLLLRFMAVLKLAMVVAALALAFWRIGLSASGTLATSYTGAVVLMACGPGLIWHTSTVIYGAVLFHGGLLVFAGLALRDDGAWRRARGAHLAVRSPETS